MRVSTLVLLALFCAACGDDREKLVIYSAHGPDILAEYEAAFESQHPEIDVVRVYDGSRNLLARLRAEKQNPQGSVWWGGDLTGLRLAASDGLLEPYQPSYAQAQFPRAADFAWTGTFQLPIALGYHPARIAKAEVPRTLEALADPKWKGQIILRSPVGSGTMSTVLSWIVAREVAAGRDESAGRQLLERLHANVFAYEASPDLMFEKLEKGPASLTIWNLTDLVFQHEVKGYGFEPIGFAEPVPVLLDGIALVRGGKSPAAAKSFYEFVNSMDELKRLATRHGRLPARSDFPADSLSAPIRAVPFAPFTYPESFDDDKRESIVRHFQTEIQGRGR